MERERQQRASTSARFVVRAVDGAAAERLAAEAWAAGAAGIEEREADGGIELVIYAPRAEVSNVRTAVEAGAGAELVGPVADVPDTDWSEQWKAGLKAIDVSPRLRIRPSFVEVAAVEGQAELVIDPGQAFGTGGHESTQLALEWLDALLEDLPPKCRLLDVGTGTGVIALAAIALAGAAAVAFDLDPIATTAARENARNNALAERMHVFTGPLEALGGTCFDLVVANLLKREMLPLAAGIAAATRPGGLVILSGLLESDAVEVGPVFEAAGFSAVDVRARMDANGARWVSLLMRR